MEPGPHDIPAPKAREIVRPEILIVPLVGFDAANYRLGYGGGYFDRTLACGIAAADDARGRARGDAAGDDLSPAA